MVKKVVVAAAGRGTRMLHLTDDKPKHLIKVNERPFLFYVLDSLFKAGYKEIILVAGYKKEMMEEFVADFTRDYIVPFAESSGATIKFINQYAKLNPEKEYGTACPLMIKEVKDFIGDEQFLFVCGDNLYSIEDLRGMNMDDEYNYVAGLVHENPERYGVLVNGGEFLKEIIEKPKEPIGNLINAGMYKFTPEVFEKIDLIKKSSRGEYEITDAISLLAKKQKVKVKKIKDYWKDFGCPSDIDKLSKFLKESGNK